MIQSCFANGSFNFVFKYANIHELFKLNELKNNYLEECIENYLAIFKNIMHQG